MKRIGLLGGTFDPPHHGHLLIAQEAKAELSLDEVWFIPVSIPPHKQREGLTSGKDRYQMIEAAIKDDPSFEVLDIELKRNGKSYTIETVKQLKREFENNEFFFLIGADMVAMLDDWHKIDELKSLVTFVAFNRPGSQVKKTEELTFIPFIEINISSSIVRDRVQCGKPIHYFVPKEVEQFIKERQLYESER